MVLEEQVCALINFLEGHQDLALGHISRTMEGRSLAKRRWSEIAFILNGIVPDCPNKSATQWRSFFNEYKAKLMKKIREMKMATGGGPRKKHLMLTPLQERLYDILWRDNKDLGARHNADEETFEDSNTNKTTDELNESDPTTSSQDLSFITPPVKRRQKNPPELAEAKQHMEHALNYMTGYEQEQHSTNNLDDECTIFGQLIARKIRRLSEERRDIMMVKINQLFVDEHNMQKAAKPYSASTTYTPSSLEVYPRTEDFPTYEKRV